MNVAVPIIILATLAVVIIAGGFILIVQATLASVIDLVNQLRFQYKWRSQPRDYLVKRYMDLINQRLLAVGSFSDIRKQAVSCIRDIAENENDKGKVLQSPDWIYGANVPRVYRYLWYYVVKLFELKQAQREKESAEKEMAYRARREELLKEEERNCHNEKEIALNEEVADRKRAETYLAARLQEEVTINESILLKYKELTGKFLEIAYRKVSRLDDYGDENWGALSAEVDTCLKKIEQREGRSLSSLYFKGKLEEMFREYHTSQKLRLSDKREFNDLSGVQFEMWVAEKLKANGFLDVRGTPTTGDQGADLIAKANNESIAIQVKRYQGAVGNSAVQQVIAARHYYGATHAWVVTNSIFTSSARELANKGRVHLIDGPVLDRIDGFLKEWIKLNSSK